VHQRKCKNLVGSLLKRMHAVLENEKKEGNETGQNKCYDYWNIPDSCWCWVFETIRTRVGQRCPLHLMDTCWPKVSFTLNGHVLAKVSFTLNGHVLAEGVLYT
jgi:hypothetical protein